MQQWIKRLFDQFGRPHGVLGTLVGWLMAFSNAERMQWLAQQITVQPNDTLLELGYGPGSAIAALSPKLQGGVLYGVDISDVMYKQASARNAKAIQSGKVVLQCGNISSAHFPDAMFDTIYASNVHFFWTEPIREFRTLLALLKPTGKLFLVFQPRWATSDEQVHAIANETQRQLLESGFAEVQITTKAMKPVLCVCIQAKKA